MLPLTRAARREDDERKDAFSGGQPNLGLAGVLDYQGNGNGEELNKGRCFLRRA